MSTDYDHRMGEHIYRLRLDAGITQADMVVRLRACGVPMQQATLCRTEQGKRSLRAREIEPFAAALGLSAWGFLETVPERVDDDHATHHRRVPAAPR